MRAIILTPDSKMHHVTFYGFYKKMDSDGKWRKWALVGEDGSVFLEYPEMVLLPWGYKENE